MNNSQAALIAAAISAPNEVPAAIVSRARHFAAYLDAEDADLILKRSQVRSPDVPTRPVRDNPQA